MERVLTNGKSRSCLLQNLSTFVLEGSSKSRMCEVLRHRIRASLRGNYRSGSMNALVVTPNTKVSIDTIVQ